MNQNYLKKMVVRLCALPAETEWLEFKQNNADAEQIGQYISALANTACFLQKASSYIVWGVEDGTHKILGTEFHPDKAKRGNQTLELFLTVNLTPRLDFRFHETLIDGNNIVLLEIPAASSQPIRWKDKEYIRVGNSKVELREVPDKERELWRLFALTTFECNIARPDLAADEALALLDYSSYFDLVKRSIPTNRESILDSLESEFIIQQNQLGGYDITNSGALLFAKKLSAFVSLGRKAVRVIVYEGKGRFKTIREHVSDRGYAAGFESVVSFINSQLPANEEIGQALRRDILAYPEIAIRELTANAIIHQDLTITGTSPVVEIFSDRIEISNPGMPLIDPLRFIDERRSRNEKIAESMRLCNICEERGSGIDKTLQAIEVCQLPAPEFSAQTHATVARLFMPKVLVRMSKVEKLRACYQHTCLQYVTNQDMTNSTLRKRLAISDENYSIASRIISDTVEQGLIKPADPDNNSRRLSRYIPFWS